MNHCNDFAPGGPSIGNYKCLTPLVQLYCDGQSSTDLPHEPENYITSSCIEYTSPQAGVLFYFFQKTNYNLPIIGRASTIIRNVPIIF
jgi:hypothetical protein